MQIPKAKKIPHKIVQHGQTRDDSFFWLRDENWKDIVAGKLNFKNTEILDYINSENSYTKSQMGDTEETQKILYGEILSRIKEDNISTPFQKGDYFYYYKEEKGKNYSILCRKKGSLDADEEVYFDINKEAEPYELYMTGSFLISSDNNLLAYSFNTSGSMERTLKVRNLQTGEDFSWEVSGTNGSYQWCEDNQHLYYVLRDPNSGRGHEVYVFNIEEGPSSKKCVFKKTGELDKFFMGLSKSTSKEYLFISCSKGDSTVHYGLKSNEPSAEPELLVPFKENVLSYLEHYKDKFYITTNLGEKENFQVMECPVNNMKYENWVEYISESETECIESISVYGNKMIIFSQDNDRAVPVMKIRDLDDHKEQVVAMKDDVYDYSFMGNADPNATVVRFEYESPCTPTQTIDLDLQLNEQKIISEKEVPNFDSSQYGLKRVMAPGHDGTQIPMTIVYKKGMELDNTCSALVYAYGSYGITYPSHFKSTIFSLIDRGFVYAIAHIRGGSDRGHKWYLDGKMMNKKNTFHDFISCCEYLIDKGYADKDKISINGGSAGGLLMGTVTNMRPDLFKVVVADVAFVDMINTISDDSLPLTPPEWTEWGNPITNKDHFEYMMSYSPYDNVEAKNYPHTLYNSGIGDEQVTYWEPTKMVARLRDLKIDNNTLLLNMRMNAGHAGASKKYEWIEEVAFNYAFILKYINQ